MKHSSVVGGSTASRVINCPGSVALCAKMPPKPSSSYAEEGTMLHEVITNVLEQHNNRGYSLIGNVDGLTTELLEDKVHVALDRLDEIDPAQQMEFATEETVRFGSYIEGAFGSVDFIGRIGTRAVVLDWKFGDGVIVSAEENSQLMYYCAAAMRTPELAWVFDGATEVELVIIQPPEIRRWVTTFDRIKRFERTLKKAVKISTQPDAKLHAGDHCRWCAAKPVCPIMTGAVDRALRTQIDGLDVQHISMYLKNADLLEQWIKSLRELALQVLENGRSIPDFKLVQKQSRRKWVDEATAKQALLMALPESEVIEMSLISPAVAEKALKKLKLPLPEGLTVSVSSGTTLASADDPRPPVLQLSSQLAGLSKLL